ncbi:CU044_2847 family protein [Phormidesmis sp. 146-33]
MGQLTPISLEDGTTIYIEATDDTATTRGDVVRGKPYDDNTPRSPVIIGEPPKQIAQTFEAIEHTVRAHTTYTLNAFKQVAIAEVSEVTLKFGVSISSEAGIPYIANAKGGCNMEITVKCEFPKKTGQ